MVDDHWTLFMLIHLKDYCLKRHMHLFYLKYDMKLDLIFPGKIIPKIGVYLHFSENYCDYFRPPIRGVYSPHNPIIPTNYTAESPKTFNLVTFDHIDTETKNQPNQINPLCDPRRHDARHFPPNRTGSRKSRPETRGDAGHQTRI